MATIDRVDPAYTVWTPSAAGIATDSDAEDYVGRHRRPGVSRFLSLRATFYTARHRRRSRR